MKIWMWSFVTFPIGISIIWFGIITSERDTIAGPEVGLHPMSIIFDCVGAFVVAFFPLFIHAMKNSDDRY